jgi:Glycosyl transferase family group 2
MPFTHTVRHAIESIGGFATGSITEDFKTSLTLAAAGFKCKYYLQRMTRGVSPKELDAFMVQVRCYTLLFVTHTLSQTHCAEVLCEPLLHSLSMLLLVHTLQCIHCL